MIRGDKLTKALKQFGYDARLRIFCLKSPPPQREKLDDSRTPPRAAKANIQQKLKRSRLERCQPGSHAPKIDDAEPVHLMTTFR